MFKLQDQTVVTSPNDTDIAYVVQDPSGTPQDGKVSLADLKIYFQTGVLTAETDSVVGAVSGIVKADGAGNISAASAGSDYVAPGGESLASALSNASITPASDGTYSVYNDGSTTGQVTSITITSGIITGITTI